MIETEAIDKVAITINPMFLNTDYYFHHTSLPRYVSTTIKGYDYLTVLIQYEALQMSSDIQEQVLQILMPFINPYVLLLKYPSETILKFIKRVSPILFSVTELECYFDLLPCEILVVNPDAFIQCYSPDSPNVITYYSPDYRNGKTSKKHRRSIVDIYNRHERLMKVNQQSHESILSNPYFMRLEFHFASTNFNYLNLSNLEGNYNDIVSRHMDYLAMFYTRYLLGNIDIKLIDNEHPILSELISKCGTGRERVRNGKLIRKNETGACFSKTNRSMEARLMSEKAIMMNKRN